MVLLRCWLTMPSSARARADDNAAEKISGRSGPVRHGKPDRPFWRDIRLRAELSAAEPMKRLTIDILLVMHTTIAAVVLLAFWFWP